MSCNCFYCKFKSSHMVDSDSRERFLTLLIISLRSVFEEMFLCAIGKFIRLAVN